MKDSRWSLCLILPLLLYGCDTTNVPAPGEAAQSDKPRVLDPVVPAGDLDELVAGNNAFAWDLYGQVSGTPGNVFYSPYSMSVALAMTYAGARTQTETAMAQAMHYTLPQARLHPAFNLLDQGLAGRAETGGFELHIVNRLWGQTGFTFLAAFLDTLAENYGAGLNLLDFQADPEGSRTSINDWVAAVTAQRIKDLIPSGAVDSSTRLVLTNAIYFKAHWLDQFEPANTQDAPFTLLDGSQVTVRMMYQQTGYSYAAGADYQAVELPYEGDELSMVILLPAAGQFEAFEGTMTAERLAAIVAGLSPQEVGLSLPKFTFEWSAGLADVLTALGMGIAFDPGSADFSGMSDTALFIQAVVHKAFVAVDEEGTEAAAATAVIAGLTAAPAEPIILRVDRPFLFVIRDRVSGTLLFVGRVVNPSA